METSTVQIPSELMPLLEDVKIQNNELVNKYLPQDLSIHLSKDRWLWTYRCLDSNDDFGLTFESPIHALCHFVGLILQKQEDDQSFSKIAQNFQDALNEALEDEPYDDEIMGKLTEISDILNCTIQDL